MGGRISHVLSSGSVLDLEMLCAIKSDAMLNVTAVTTCRKEAAVEKLPLSKRPAEINAANRVVGRVRESPMQKHPPSFLTGRSLRQETRLF
jgi:hypothetical protein